MVRHLLGVASVALLALMVGGCSSTPIDSSEQGAAEADVGSVNLPLTTSAGGADYRLNKATFTIFGPTLSKPLVVVPPPDEPVHNVVLPVGSYSIELSKGWVLEKRGPAEKAFAAVPAQLVTSNPLGFEVDGKTPADAFFGFVTTSGDVTLGNGSVNIRIGVQDCSAYDSITAALGELTADCLGTVDPRAYRITRDGFLTPAFDSCPVDKSRLLPILQLLSLQKRVARLPFAQQCVAGRFETFQRKFAESGINVCPSWSSKLVINPITTNTIDAVLKSGLPELPAADTGQTPRGVDLLKQASQYTVKLDTMSQACKSPADCAVQCAAAFPGFVLGSGDGTVLVDPVAWLIDTTYQSSTSDPYLARATYYHPMSYYGTLPGVSFGALERFQPCGNPPPMGVVCAPEQCSYYAGTHIKTALQKDCLDDADITSCVSYCGPKLPAPLP
jgi:hypothetical protein